MSIQIGPISNLIVFINDVKTILPILEPLGLIKFCLQPFFFEIKLNSIGSSIKKSQKEKTRFQLSRINSKRFSVSPQEIPGPLLIYTELRLREILSISQKKSCIELHIQSTYKLSSNSLILLQFSIKKPRFGTSANGYVYLFQPSCIIEDKIQICEKNGQKIPLIQK